MIALAVLALTLGNVWQVGAVPALAICAGGVLLAYLLVWVRVAAGLAPLLAQGIGAVICVRVVAGLPPPTSGPLLVLQGEQGTPGTGWLLDAVLRTVGPERAVSLLLLFLLWEVAYTFVWLILREHWAWAATALAGVALIAAGGIAGVNGTDVVIFAMAALLLVLWTTMADHTGRWRREMATLGAGVHWPSVVGGVEPWRWPAYWPGPGRRLPVRWHPSLP